MSLSSWPIVRCFLLLILGPLLKSRTHSSFYSVGQFERKESQPSKYILRRRVLLPFSSSIVVVLLLRRYTSIWNRMESLFGSSYSEPSSFKWRICKVVQFGVTIFHFDEFLIENVQFMFDRVHCRFSWLGTSFLGLYVAYFF